MTDISSKNSITVEYLLIGLFPILSLYKFIPIPDWGFFILLILLMFRLIKQDFVAEVNMGIFYTMLLLSILNLLVGLFKYPDLTNSIKNTISMLIFMVIAMFYCAPAYLDGEKFYKVCKQVAIAATLFLIFQFIAYYGFGLIFRGNIPFMIPADIGFVSMEYGRPNSFFYEPAHYAIYVAPIYAMAILKKEYKLAIFLFVGVILSTSTTGIVLLVLIPILMNIRNVKLLAYLFLFILLGVVGFFYLPDFFSRTLAKLSLDNLMQNYRIFGTFTFFQYFKLPEWLFGVGHNRLAEFLVLSGESDGLNLANSLVFMVFSFGLFGAAVFLNLLMSMFRRLVKDRRIMWWLLLFVLASDQVLFNRNLLYLLIWVTVVSIPPLNGQEELLE